MAFKQSALHGELAAGIGICMFASVHWLVHGYPTVDFAPEAVAYHDTMVADHARYLYRELEGQGK